MPAAALAKLSRPKLYSAVPRARLFQRLDEAREHPGIWVCGPPGAGKTTLVASYVSEREIPGIWYQVDSADSDPATFFYYLGTAAERAVKGKHRPLPLLTPEFQHDVDGFARRYFRELFARLPEGALLVLDNVQEASAESPFQSVLAALVEEVPDGVNAVLISRAELPSAFARHASTGQLATVEWPDLRLTLDETRQIAAAKHAIGEQVLVRLFDQSEGWVAGLTLMLERVARTGDVPEAIEAQTREAVFNYFAGTLFDKLPADARQVLLRTAFLAQITPTFAESLTGNPNAGKLLEHLHRRHLFTYRLPLRQAHPKGRGLATDEATYQYHALFRDFLLAKAREEYTRAGLRRLCEETAQLLETTEQDEEAVALYGDAENWGAYARSLLKQAANLLLQGRGQTLRDRIVNMPEREVSNQPWLSYWLGVSLIPVDQPEAIEWLERAFAQFRSADDPIGQVACAARVIEAIYRAYVNYKPVERWIELLDELLTAELEFPDRDIELRAYCSLLLATFASRPHHPRLQSSVERVLDLLSEGLEPDQMVTAGDVLLRYFDWAVDAPKARWVIGRVEGVVEDKSVAPLSQLYWWTRTGACHIRDGRLAEGEAMLRKADAIAVNFRAHTANLLLGLWWVFLALARHDVGQAKERVVKLLQAMDPHRDGDVLLVKWAQALLACHTDTLARAVEASRTHVDVYSLVGVFFAQMHGNIQLAALLAASGEFEELERLVDDTRRAIRGTYMSHVDAQLLLIEAFAALRRNERRRACDFASRAIALPAETDLLVLRVVPDVLATVLAFALREGIGTARVRGWIERYRIPGGAQASEHWPWAVKLYLLGGLRLVCRDQALQFKKKAPQKPLELLVLLVTGGSGGLTAAAIADRLWPDLQADAATVNVDTNVYRLRKLLGVEDAIVSANGRVTLNPLRCWTDVWAFERLASECMPASGETLIDNAREALALYQGPLLNKDGEQPWTLALRERLSARMIQLTESVGKALEDCGDREAAIALYQRALTLDNLAEPIYRRLIACLREKGEPAEALKVYRHCRELLSIVLGVQPSQETQALAATLRQ